MHQFAGCLSVNQENETVFVVAFTAKRSHKYTLTRAHVHLRADIIRALFNRVYSPVNPPCDTGSPVRNRLNVTARCLQTTLWRWVGDLFPWRPGSHLPPTAHSQPVTKWAGAAPPKLQRAAASKPPRGPLMSGNPILQRELDDFSESYKHRWKRTEVVYSLI